MFMNRFGLKLVWYILWNSTFCYWCRWPWHSFKVRGMEEGKKCCTNCLTKFLIDLDDMCQAEQFYWLVEVQTQFTSSNSYSWKRTQVSWFHPSPPPPPSPPPKKNNTGLHADVYKPIFFKLGMMVDTVVVDYVREMTAIWWFWII